jgi:rare lipoprotein A
MTLPPRLRGWCPAPPAKIALHLRRAGAFAAAALLLSACGSAPPRPSTNAASAETSKAAAPARRGSGGFYKDDGPGSDPPPDLAATPDASPRPEPLHTYANRPYRVMGQSFVPRTSLAAYRMRGVASWYGRRFHGLPTASGEPYDMYAMTAAHPTLPIPSYARVTHLASGRAVVVRINDRGPFLHGRIMDLSYTAAWKLGYVENGSAEVEVEQILPGETGRESKPGRERENEPGEERKQGEKAPPAPPPDEEEDDDPLGTLIAGAMMADEVNKVADGMAETPAAGPTPPPAGGQRVFLQLGAFATRENAESLRARAAAQLAGLAGRLEIVTEGGRFRVYGGPFESLANAREVAEQVNEQLDIRPFAVQRTTPATN